MTPARCGVTVATDPHGTTITLTQVVTFLSGATGTALLASLGGFLRALFKKPPPAPPVDLVAQVTGQNNTLLLEKAGLLQEKARLEEENNAYRSRLVAATEKTVDKEVLIGQLQILVNKLEGQLGRPLTEWE